MRYIILFALSLLTFGVLGQMEQYKACSAIILGYESDTVFKASCETAIATLNTTSEELDIKLFKKDIKDDHPRVLSFFKSLEGDIIISAKLENNIFEISDNSSTGHIVRDLALLTFNGVSKKVAMSYQINGLVSSVDRTNGSLLTQPNITINIFFNPADFNVSDSASISNPIEIEIYEGILNEQN